MPDYNFGIAPVNGAFGQYAFDDLDMDLNYGSYPMYGAGSVFGNGFATTPMMGMGMPMVGGGGYNMQDMYDNMSQQQQYQTDYQIKQQELNRNADLRINAPMEAIKGAAMALKDKITSNEQDQIQEAYERYVNAVAAAYGNADPAVIKARANNLYTNMNNGVSLVQELRQHGHGSATQGFIQSLTFGLYDRNSAEDNISVITGSPVGTTEKTNHNLGRLAGAATVGGIAGGAVKALTKSSKLAAAPGIIGKIAGKMKGKAGLIGLAVAGIAAGISFLTGKVTT